MTLGSKLARLRKEHNFTQEQLAEILGVSRQAISKWESDRTYPETEKLVRICRLFQCSTDYLLLEEAYAGKPGQNVPASGDLQKHQLLMDGSRLTDMQEYRLQCSYSLLLHCTLFWIFSLPLLFVKYAPVCFAGLAVTLMSGALYIFRCKKKKTADDLAIIPVSESRRRKKTIWSLWGVAFSVFTITKAALLFGSNLWFGRPVEITGPYSVLDMILQFYVPLLTIFIPITAGSFTNILLKQGKRCGYGKEK